MNNQMTIQSDYNMQMKLALEGITEKDNQTKKQNKKLVFQPYNNKALRYLVLKKQNNITL